MICSSYFRSQEEETRMDTLAEELGTVQNFQQIVPRVLKVVISALDAPPVFMRTKALRALGQIVTSDPTVLSLV
jgi:cohesin loading factor subunit SCC2